MSQLFFDGKQDLGKNPPRMLFHIFKINLWKTYRRKWSRAGRARFSEFPHRHPLGAMAPELKLQTTDGRTVSLHDFRGRKHVLLEFGSYA